MNPTAHFEMDAAYFSERFEDWLHSGSRFRRWQRQIAVASFVAALVAVRFPGLPIYVSIGLFMVGVVEGLEFYWYRANWVAQRIEAQRHGPVVVEMHFTQSGIDTKGSASHGHIPWNGVREVIQTPRGLTFKVGDGMSIYVPRRSVVPIDSVRQIAEWAKSNA